MTTTLQLLLRLPPSLRCQTIAPFLNRSLKSQILNSLPRRPFTHISRTFKQPRSPKSPPKPSPRQTKPPRQQSQPKLSQNQPPPRPPNYSSQLLALLDSTPSSRILLYASPSHTTFYLNSYVLGTLFLLAGTNIALFTRPPPDDANITGAKKVKVPFWLQILNLTPAFFFAILATTFFLGPTKLIRRVSLVRKTATAGGQQRGSPVYLRFELKHPLPFMPFVKRTGTIDTSLSRVVIDRQISSKDLHFLSIPLSQSQTFTSQYLNPPTPAPRSIGSRLRGFNASLVNIWPTLVQDIRRMFTRDGMAYIRITGHGNWKLDLQGCELLDEGRALLEVMGMDEAMDRSWWRGLRWVRERLS